VHDVDLFVLEVALGHQHNITGGDPHLFAHFPTNVPQSRHTIETKALAASIPEHLYDLSVFLACDSKQSERTLSGEGFCRGAIAEPRSRVPFLLFHSGTNMFIDQIDCIKTIDGTNDTICEHVEQFHSCVSEFILNPSHQTIVPYMSRSIH